LRNATRVFALFLVLGFSAATGLAGPGSAPQADQNVKVIEMTAKKYEFSPSPVHVKAGTKVQLKISSLDRKHGIKIEAYPDGSDKKGDPGLVFSSKEECFVEFVAKTPGTYSFKCCVHCGLGHGGMKGQLIVEP
jgi:cytochrome c oxidase subunit 2